MIKNFGDTANGKVSGSIPYDNLRVPEWNMRNPFNDLIGIALKEREMELKEKEMGLKEKGLGLDEQKFAYGAANDEASRQFALKLQEMKNKNTRDNLDYEYSLKNSYNNRIKAEEDPIQKEINKYYGYLQSLEDQGMNISDPHFFTVARDNAKAIGNTDILNFLNNNGIKAAEVNKLYMENKVNRDIVGELMKEHMENGNSTDPYGFNTNRTETNK